VGVYQNLAADPVNYLMLECTCVNTVLMENGILQNCVNVFHMRRTAGTNPADVAGVLDQLRQFWINQVLPLLNNRAEFLRAEARPLDDPLVLAIENATGATTPGGVSGDSLPLDSAVSMELYTGGRGRSFRGRKHWAPLSESDTTKDELTGTPLANWQSFANGIPGSLHFTDGNSNTWDLTVLSKQLSKLDLPSIVFTGSDVVSAFVNPIIGTMRRRKEKAGG